jgi:hypothetical protein
VYKQSTRWIQQLLVDVQALYFTQALSYQCKYIVRGGGVEGGATYKVTDKGQRVTPDDWHYFTLKLKMALKL